jgi:hypothetical protein
MAPPSQYAYVLGKKRVSGPAENCNTVATPKPLTLLQNGNKTLAYIIQGFQGEEIKFRDISLTNRQ